MGERSMLDLYKHYKFYHFFSICFGLGCGMCGYRPFYSLAIPVIVTVFCMFIFEAVGCCFGLPAHTKRCKGPPYHWRDALWGFVCALLVAALYIHSYHVYTLSYGSGITVFALRGAKRKCSALWKENTLFTTWSEGSAFFSEDMRNRGQAYFSRTNGNSGSTNFTRTNTNRGHAFFTGPTGTGGHTPFTGNRSYAYFTNGDRSHTYFTRSQGSTGHAHFTRSQGRKGHASSTGTY